MKLALIYHQFIRSGGLENYLIEFATRLSAAGHEVELVTARIAPEVQAKLREVGNEPRALGPAEFERFIAAENEKWREVVRRSGARLD